LGNPELNIEGQRSRGQHRPQIIKNSAEEHKKVQARISESIPPPAVKAIADSP
jgi:adenylate kinase